MIVLEMKCDVMNLNVDEERAENLFERLMVGGYKYFLVLCRICWYFWYLLVLVLVLVGTFGALWNLLELLPSCTYNI